MVCHPIVERVTCHTSVGAATCHLTVEPEICRLIVVLEIYRLIVVKAEQVGGIRPPARVAGIPVGAIQVRPARKR